jgi:hypothetical protein
MARPHRAIERGAGRLYRPARELSAGRERRELGVGDVRRHRRHAAIGAGVEPFRRDMVERGANGLRDLLRRLYDIGCDVDAAINTSYP